MNNYNFKHSEPKKEETAKLEPVVKTAVTERKDNELAKFFRSFIADDVANVKDHMLYKVLIPSIQDAIIRTLTAGVKMIFNGGNAPSSTAESISYKKYDYTSSSSYSAATPTFSFDISRMIISTELEAHEILSRIFEQIDEYGVCTVANVYELMDKHAPYTAWKYGWTSLPRDILPIKIPEGYILKLPKPRAL